MLWYIGTGNALTSNFPSKSNYGPPYNFVCIDATALTVDIIDVFVDNNSYSKGRNTAMCWHHRWTWTCHDGHPYHWIEQCVERREDAERDFTLKYVACGNEDSIRTTQAPITQEFECCRSPQCCDKDIKSKQAYFDSLSKQGEVKRKGPSVQELEIYAKQLKQADQAIKEAKYEHKRCYSRQIYEGKVEHDQWTGLLVVGGVSDT